MRTYGIVLWVLLTITTVHAEDFYSCQSSEECVAGGCGGSTVCANSQAYAQNSSSFQSVLGKCTDSMTPGERGLKCKCFDQKCGWVKGEFNEMKILPEEQICELNEDCVVMPTHCGDCSCGAPINKKFYEQYQAKHTAQCKDYHGAYCDFYCSTPIAACINQKCTLTMDSRT